MKIIVLLITLLTSPVSLSAQESFIGHWNTGQENTIIEIKEVDSKIEGRIFSSDNSKASTGNFILKYIYRDEDQVKGKLYSPKRGRWFDASFSPKSNDIEFTITAGWVERKANWKKLQ
jgi:uncharacterized protein (DUF2147 family)